MEWAFPAKVIRIVDGDTFKMQADLGFDIEHKVTVRLLSSGGGVDTAETRSLDHVEKALGLRAKQRVTQLMPLGMEVIIHTEKVKQDGFARYLAQVTLPDGRDLGDILLAEGLAIRWKG